MTFTLRLALACRWELLLFLPLEATGVCRDAAGDVRCRHPWMTIGLAAVAGFLVGALSRR
ncbi:hypothetical protein [Devosia sp.]|uniref:glycine zipper domain-containing protein n=1 Tax=Devosia sp. TaxID=1871048 RepID=UPI003523804D